MININYMKIYRYTAKRLFFSNNELYSKFYKMHDNCVRVKLKTLNKLVDHTKTISDTEKCYYFYMNNPF